MDEGERVSKPKPERGQYRSITVVLLDGPDFQQLPPEARWVFTALKISLGPCGIQVEYPAGLVEKLAGRTGYDQATVAAMLNLLQSTGWIKAERNVVWIVKQLKFEPSMTPKNDFHRASVLAHVQGLPKLAIVGDFVKEYQAYIDAWEDVAKSYPAPGGGYTIAYGGGLPQPSESQRPKTETETETETAAQAADAVPESTPQAASHTLGSVIALVVEHLYFGTRPAEAAIRNEASIAKALAKTYGYDRLASAVLGLAKRREAGELPNVGRRQVMSLRWLNSDKFDLNQVAVSEDAVYRSESSPRTGRGATAMADILGNIGRSA
jgi:hypothetical protein